MVTLDCISYSIGSIAEIYDTFTGALTCYINIGIHICICNRHYCNHKYTCITFVFFNFTSVNVANSKCTPSKIDRCIYLHGRASLCLSRFQPIKSENAETNYSRFHKSKKCLQHEKRVDYAVYIGLSLANRVKRFC